MAKTIKITEKQYDFLLSDKHIKRKDSFQFPKQFGNKLQDDLIKLENGELNEAYYKTYPAQTVASYIRRMLGNNNGEVYFDENEDTPLFNVFVPNNKNILAQLDKSFSLCGYHKSFQRNIQDGNVVNLQYEPRYSKDVNQTVKEIGYLYHVTPTKHLKKIMSNGLSPRTTNKVFNYPPRVYFLMGDASENLILDTINMLSKGNITVGGKKQNAFDDVEVNEWSVLGIDVSKLNGDIKFYVDWNLDNGYSVYTNDNIPSSAIEHITNVKWE